MPVVEESVLISREPQEVFDYLSIPENNPLWDSTVAAARQLDDGPVTVGTRWSGTNKILGRRFDWTTEITEVHVPEVLASRSVEGKLHFTARYDLRPESGGTRLTYRIEAESGLGGMFGRFADPLVESAQGKALRANLARLAELLDRQPVQ